MPFSAFFNETVTVDNRAKNGRSTKSFIAEQRWQAVMDQLKEGDYILIQFGHNDEVPTKANYTPEDQFAANLVRFITESRSRKAIPVLITPWPAGNSTLKARSRRPTLSMPHPA